MGPEPRGRADQGQPGANPPGEERRARPEPKVKSFEIGKRLIVEAWEKVRANNGAPGVDAGWPAAVPASSARPASPRPGSRAEPRFVIPRASVAAAANTVRPAGDASDTSPSADASPRPSLLTRRNPVVLTRGECRHDVAARGIRGL